MQALALAALLLADAAPRAGAVSPLHRFLPSEGGAWPAARTLPGADHDAALSWRRRTEDRPWRSLTCEESTEDVSDATGVPHPYVYEVSGLGALVLLHGTVHVSTFLLYGGEHGGPPRETSRRPSRTPTQSTRRSTSTSSANQTRTGWAAPTAARA